MPDFTNRTFGAVASEQTRPLGPANEHGATRDADVAQIKLGTLLNHIYRVDRLIGRGGMGEVYFGVNINTDEQVAIKIILASLSNDPNVRALFRKEARTLTRLLHPALVPYRALAQDPELGVLYIVSEYVDGPALADVLPDLHAGPEQMIALMRRLASGLAAAHEIGAVHRDISPENILLPQGRLELARIIDFGIAKDLQAAHRSQVTKTILGAGFAGKFGYVAPEQFAESSQVGPWTDVYSLGLLILAVAAGRPLDMGSTFVDAIEKRRTVPDLSFLPEVLRPVINRMVEPDCSRRYRSMDALLAALDGLDKRHEERRQRFEPAVTERRPVAGGLSPPAPKRSYRTLALMGCVLLAILAMATTGFLLHGGTPTVREESVVKNQIDSIPSARSSRHARANSPWLSPDLPIFPERFGTVVDEANVLPPLGKLGLETAVADAENKTGIDLTIVTVKSLSGLTIKDYAKELAKHWSQDLAGIVLVVCPQQGSAQIEVGDGLYAAFPEQKAQQILNEYMLPAFQNSDFDAGIEAGARAIIEQIEAASVQIAAPSPMSGTAFQPASRPVNTEVRRYHKKHHRVASSQAINSAIDEQMRKQKAGSAENAASRP